MSERFHTSAARKVRLVLDLAVGHVRDFEVSTPSGIVRPLHTAPWVEDAEITRDADILPNLKYLSGDFFCAPFAASDIEPAPSHGWPANSAWSLLGETRAGNAVTSRFELGRPVMGARLVKEITLRDDHPFAYQRHVFTGGSGAVSVASHGMTRLGSGGGALSFSPKAFGETPSALQETDPTRGRSVFVPATRFTDLSRMPLADGSIADLHRYPVANSHEDFVMLAEVAGSKLGWTAVVRPDAGDVFLSLKNPTDFPMTFLWYSNGGRFYAPWNGRHVGVLGVEEGRAVLSHSASIAGNSFSRSGISTSLPLGGTAEVRHVIGGVPLPPGWQQVDTVVAVGGLLTLTSPAGDAVRYPFDDGFLAPRVR